MAIKFTKNKDLLIFSYNTTDLSWLTYKLSNDEEVTIQKTFTFTKKHLHETDLESLENDDLKSVEFIFAKIDQEYYRIDKDILSTKLPVYIHKNIEFKENSFVSAKNISIFRRIDSLMNNVIYIGGDKDNSLPQIEFTNLVKNFPNTYEQKKYANAIISSMLKNYFDDTSDAEASFNKYINKKKRNVGSNIYSSLRNQELHKYQIILEKLQEMLAVEESYTEAQWQQEILQIILLLYPKYIQAFTEVKIRDVYNKKDRRLDFMLLDTSGNIDIIEIKKPFNNAIITKGKYRDNHIPLRDLSGTIMQIEKYIFYLNKWGKKGEDKLTKVYEEKIPKDMSVKITNPSALIIMGRDNKLTKIQKEDFEIVKRKYKNIVDIITYDDLISRLKFIIQQWIKT